MIAIVSISRQHYRFIRAHLFKGRAEQACFLMAHSEINGAVIHLHVREAHYVHSDRWDFQSDFHLELSEAEKVKIMLKARDKDCDLIECHSHLMAGQARFSSSDVTGLGEFVPYVWWKLPGKIYGALVWTRTDVSGEIWLPKKKAPIQINEIRIVN